MRNGNMNYYISAEKVRNKKFIDFFTHYVNIYLVEDEI